MAERAKTGMEVEYIEKEVLPLFGAHMHIQSNNCCPLPVQLGVLAASIVGFHYGRKAETDRKELLDTLCSTLSSIVTGRFGKVGRLSSDLVARLYMGELQDSDFRVEHIWTIYDDQEKKKIKKKKNLLNDEQVTVFAAHEARLSDMNAASKMAWKTEFEEKTAYYFRNTTIARMSLTLCMDLSYTNYWGRYGLPVYLEADNSMYFINDFVAVNLERKGMYKDKVELTFDNGVVTPESFGDNDVNNDKGSLFREKATIHLHASFFNDDHFANATTSFYRRQFALSSLPTFPTENDYPILRFFPGDGNTRLLSEKTYIHFMDQARGEEKAWFEDYAMQRELTIASMVNYPLSLFGAYHYDPRRHLIDGRTVTPDSLAEKILNEHAFFTTEYDPVEESHISNGVYYKGVVKVSPHSSLNDTAHLTNLLSEQQRTTEDALDDVFTCSGEGPFWAVKLYPRLGWAPDDFIHYPNLNTLYEKCEQKQVPLMVHCSLGGMSAHDYYLYERYDDHQIKDEYKLKDAENRFDGALPGVHAKDSPVQWKNVLQKIHSLKICLAHFGGYDTWKKVRNFERAEKKLAERGDAHNPKKYDKYDMYRDWIRTIAELVQDCDNVYTDISYFKNSGTYRSGNVNQDPLDEGDEAEYNIHIVKNLVYLLNKYDGLKDRILVGTDWLMIEMEKENGIGEYMARMFETLKQVSKELGYDVWHQFAVINPLRYFGLIDGKKGSEGPFAIDTGKLKEYGEGLVPHITDIEATKENIIKLTEEDLYTAIYDIILNFKKTIIYPSSDIKNQDQLLIIQK